MSNDVACARCGTEGLAHYWPEPGEAREAEKRAWLVSRAYAPADRLCSRCMVELESRGR